MVKTFILTYVFPICFATISIAQCDSRLNPDKNESIAYKKRGNRCEGYYKATVSSPSIQVVGFLKGRFRFDHDNRNEVIRVFSTIQDKKINIRALGIPLDTYYQMDAQLLPNQEFHWPVEDILYPNSLKAECINIFGWTGSENDKFFVPLITEPQINRSANDDKIRLYIRTSHDVSLVIWRFSKLIEGSCVSFGEYYSLDKTFRAGSAIPLIFSNLSGKFCVEIKAKKANSNKWIRKVIHILIDEN